MNKVKQIGKIDTSRYHTFFLEYQRECGIFKSHLVRPCSATYDEIADINRTRCITLESAVLTFDSSMSLAEVLIECALYGITIDFIEIKVKKENANPWSEEITIQTINTHKEDISEYFDKIAAPEFYVAIDNDRTHVLKFLVINRFLQDCSVDFMHGKYDMNAVVAGFHEQTDAVEYCKKLNKKN